MEFALAPATGGLAATSLPSLAWLPAALLFTRPRQAVRARIASCPHDGRAAWCRILLRPAPHARPALGRAAALGQRLHGRAEVRHDAVLRRAVRQARAARVRTYARALAYGTPGGNVQIELGLPSNMATFTQSPLQRVCACMRRASCRASPERSGLLKIGSALDG